MSKELLVDFDPYKYLSKSERQNISLQEFNEDFDKEKEKLKEELKKSEEEELKELTNEEEKRYKLNQLTELLAFDKIREQWSYNMFNIIKKIISFNYNYTSIELIYLSLTIIILILIYLLLYLLINHKIS